MASCEVLVALVGFKQTSVLFDRPARFAGEGKYNRLLGSLRIGLNGLICFSSYLLTLSAAIGFFIAGGSFLMGALYAVMKFLGFPFPIGNPTIVILILFMGGIQLISVGIVGEYIARILRGGETTAQIHHRPCLWIWRYCGAGIRA